MATAEEEVKGGTSTKQEKWKELYVYEAPLRLWHWVNALCIIVLIATGYLIAHPPASRPGEAIDNYLLGYIRFAHFTAAYIFAIGFLGRIYWALVGNEHARQLFKLPLYRGSWWREVGRELRWYLFLEREPKKYVGHNPLAQLAMFLFMTLGSVFMIFTGFALYAEGAGQGSWQDALFGWLIPLFGNTQLLHSWHHLGMYWIVLFVIVHIYVAFREDIMSRQSIISTMVSGHRLFKDNRRD
ncbi:Ni/Fe-hydrogenase, b-type cytochrome subunit [Alkalilimnicola ehrlichii MLHE-1]|uniref:Ni/Fe-hydrogenase, b-type cytochrome subunit n=1 Tax=Alkalilimnicola ehrlichii (strain ATCC BAA-1101 / DSM 17681 / MLHE-1) TaxID=187272 RepID=Q0A718_ALKEH|nr:Ni/Fe-hydrogenase, b-type cytochrome subunit [Alkalilimnicola ehrlichii]ABI57369.1 Ni/Fe-hydrogenase, b-type cytochrome subunit [Alkalilimnicola ehrlichii MLHE-1]